MIGTVLVSELAPLDYRYALDAAMTLLPANTPSLVLCGEPGLLAEARQRMPIWKEDGEAMSALWVEPQAGSWQTDLARLAALSAGARLVVIASRPLARILPERRSWRGDSLGLRLGGLADFRRALSRAGFVVEQSYGIHSLNAIGLNLLGSLCERLGRPDLADRLGFRARLHYSTSGPTAASSTVALMLARKEQEPC